MHSYSARLLLRLLLQRRCWMHSYSAHLLLRLLLREELLLLWRRRMLVCCCWHNALLGALPLNAQLQVLCSLKPLLLRCSRELELSTCC